MKIFFGLSKVKKYRKPVVALGVFDGLHRAHKEILKYVAKLSRQIKGQSLVVTFWPHPQKQESLYSLEHRLRLIAEIGIDVCIVIKFNRIFSQIQAEDFVKNILVKKIGAAYICVGRNFRFGKNAKGDFGTLNRLSSTYNFKLKVFDVIKNNYQPISSTYIRRLINRGKLKSAQQLLGHPVSVLGTVIKGVSLGKRLGFPTANINPHHEVLPPSGVYAVRVIFNHKKLNGICYIGKKPTFSAQKLKSIEAHIFNFNKNIYGKYLEIQFLDKLRNEKKFSSLLALGRQVKKDIARTQKMFPHPLSPG